MTEGRRKDFTDITGAIYAMLSGPAGPRDYTTVKRFYHPDARLIRTGLDDKGRAFAKVMSVDDHNADVNTLLTTMDFWEIELEHEAEIFGNVARVKSVYQSIYGTGAARRIGKGVNYFNFFFDGAAWKIAGIVWDNEREGLSLDNTAVSTVRVNDETR